jgi:hypothetical protein
MILLIGLLLIVNLHAAEGEIDYASGQAVAGFERIPEEQLIADSDARVFKPDSSTLCILTTEGDTVTFSDTSEIDEISYFKMFTLVGRLPEQDYWVVQMSGHEWGEYLLVSGKNGSYSRAISVPVPSPDGCRLLCAYRDIIACFVDNGIQIWRIDPDSLALEYSALDEEWGPSEAEWVDDSSIIFDMITVDWETWDIHVNSGKIVMTENGCWEEL